MVNSQAQAERMPFDAKLLVLLHRKEPLHLWPPQDGPQGKGCVGAGAKRRIPAAPTPKGGASTHERPKPASAAAALAARPGKPVPCRPPRALAALPTVFGELEPGLPAQLMLPMAAVAESLGLGSALRTTRG